MRYRFTHEIDGSLARERHVIVQEDIRTEVEPQRQVVVFPSPPLGEPRHCATIDAIQREALGTEEIDELVHAEVVGRDVSFRHTDAQDCRFPAGNTGRRRGAIAGKGEQRCTKKNAATHPGRAAAFTTAPARRPARSAYLLSVRGDQSSIAHGQKFWGLRVAEAFCTTLIFMSLLRFR